MSSKPADADALMGTTNEKCDDLTFPTTLEGFGYTFNTEGRIEDIETGKPFQFVVREDDRQFNQARYEALGKVVDETIFQLLETDCGLRKIEIPFDKDEEEPGSFFFASEDCTENKEKLLVIIHGSGVVRAGQWSRRLIINNNLEQGSQIPYIKKAQELGYAVLVTNGNHNAVEIDRWTRRRIRGSSSPEEHMEYVWRHFLSKCPAKFIDVMAHSYGGVVTVSWLSQYENAREKVRKIAFTDSVHSISLEIADAETRTWFEQRAINWVSSNEYVGKFVRKYRGDIFCVSAGTITHEETSWKSFAQIFAFFESAEGVSDDVIASLQKDEESEEMTSEEDEGEEQEEERKGQEKEKVDEEKEKVDEDLVDSPQKDEKNEEMIRDEEKEKETEKDNDEKQENDAEKTDGKEKTINDTQNEKEAAGETEENTNVDDNEEEKEKQPEKESPKLAHESTAL
ncbi:cotranscriptional regulator ARB2A-like [Oscarella lobularis]|uniref:cotranscriptional regulator ARB2A-like n=1 Tax=Oscarella lobularis TaxID=121494 RepID=UPI003313D996